MDEHLWPTQFGFTKAKSTQQATYSARRLQDLAEASGKPFILTLLDWGKAFDEISHDALFNALERINFPPEMITPTILKQSIKTKLSASSMKNKPPPGINRKRELGKGVLFLFIYLLS